MAKPSFTTSLGRRDLRRLFAVLCSCRVDDEFERVRILVLLHQLEIYEPFRIAYGSAAPAQSGLRFPRHLVHAPRCGLHLRLLVSAHAPFKSKLRLEAENAVLRHQL